MCDAQHKIVQVPFEFATFFVYCNYYYVRLEFVAQMEFIKHLYTRQILKEIIFSTKLPIYL